MACTWPCRMGNGMEAPPPWPWWQQVSTAGLSSALPHQPGLHLPCLLRMWGGGAGPAPPCTQGGHGTGRRQPSPTLIPEPICRLPSTLTPRAGVDSLPQDTGPSLPGPALSTQPWALGGGEGAGECLAGCDEGCGARYLNAYLLPPRFCHIVHGPFPNQGYICFSREIKSAKRMLSVWVLGWGVS